MVSQSSGLGEWYSARSSLLTSIVSQKLGLFHNQSFLRENLKPLSKYIGEGSQVEHLLKNTSPPILAPKSKHDEISDFENVYRNSMITYPQKLCAGRDEDMLKKAGKQILHIWNAEIKQYRQSLYRLWNSRGENSNVHYTEDLIRYFKQKGRMIHYVFTPLLFLPRWRRKANETRSQGTEDLSPEEEPTKTLSSSISERARHTSGGSFPKEKTKRSKSITSQGFASSPTGKSPSSSPKSTRVSPDEKFHADLITNFFQEYEQYAQTLGFSLINLHPGSFRRSGRISVTTLEGSERKRRHTAGTPKTKPKVVYLQKSLLGGLLIFEIGISEPFFYTKLHALEAQRLHPLSNQNLSNKLFTTTFLEECDNIKILIHLHSFTYDYHLRTIAGYIGDKPTQLRKGFHVVSFLEDFMKYYSKGPNFARNFIHTGSLHIISQEHFSFITKFINYR